MAVATHASTDRNRSLLSILGAVAILAFFLIAAAAAGYHTGIAWLDAWLVKGSASTSADASVSTSVNAEGSTSTQAACLLNLVCLNPDGLISFGGPSGKAGIDVNAAAEGSAP